MTPLHALMSGILDYAGLFPPAKLDMPTTVRNYAAYRGGTEHWMLGRLIVPCARLVEFEAAFGELAKPPAQEPWRMSVLTAPAGDAALEADLDRIDGFNQAHGDQALIDAIELKADTAQAIDAALDLIPADLMPAFELPWSRDPRGLVAALAGCEAAAKVRTGGLTDDLFPPPEPLARFILACAAAKAPFKATAGLHHPFRHDSAGVRGAREHGFLNVFLGATMAYHDAIDLPALTRLLDDGDSSHFRLVDRGMEWAGLRLTAEHIAEARAAFALSYGSCSFIEPLEDLRALGWLD